MIEPEVFKYFPDHDSVNDALRSLATIIEKQKRKRRKTNIKVNK